MKCLRNWEFQYLSSFLLVEKNLLNLRIPMVCAFLWASTVLFSLAVIVLVNFWTLLSRKHQNSFKILVGREAHGSR